MRIDNIIKRLRKENLNVVKGEFDFKECWMCNGTALIDLIDGEVKDTTAKWSDVSDQIINNKSHIQTIEGKMKCLTINMKLGY